MRAMVLALLLAAPAAAQTVLPDPAAVAAALDTHPSVVAARARLSSARASARAMAAGPHEFTAGASFTNRRVEGGQDFAEYDASLGRAFRLPGKARLDRKAGDALVRAADNMADDARHQAAVSLSDLWWDWLRAASERQVLAQSVATLEAASQAVRRRVALRDASMLELEQADAALASARAQQRMAAGREVAARTVLGAQFPALPLPAAAPSLSAPTLPAEDLASLGTLVIERSHEIGAAVATEEASATMAARSRRDRIADPTIGIRGFSEFGGAERGIGLMISMPLGGSHRRALADQAEAQAHAARAEAAAVRQEIAAIAGRDVANATAAYAAWQDALAARQASASAAARAERGHALGGLDLADRLYAQRLAQESALAEVAANTEAWRAITRLKIDSHTLWMHQE